MGQKHSYPYRKKSNGRKGPIVWWSFPVGGLLFFGLSQVGRTWANTLFSVWKFTILRWRKQSEFNDFACGLKLAETTMVDHRENLVVAIAAVAFAW